MRIVVSNSSCLTGLCKVSLLDALLKLPCELLIPDTLFEDNTMQFSPAQKKALVRAGLKLVDLSGERVLRAQTVMRLCPSLSVHESFAFALAENYAGCILLTGEGALGALAVQHKITARGVLWAIDELHRHGIVNAKTILLALRQFSSDGDVSLPRREVAAAIKRYNGVT